MQFSSEERLVQRAGRSLVGRGNRVIDKAATLWSRFFLCRHPALATIFLPRTRPRVSDCKEFGPEKSASGK